MDGKLSLELDIFVESKNLTETTSFCNLLIRLLSKVYPKKRKAEMTSFCDLLVRLLTKACQNLDDSAYYPAEQI